MRKALGSRAVFRIPSGVRPTPGRRRLGAVGLLVLPLAWAGMPVSAPAQSLQVEEETAPAAVHVSWKRRLGTPFEDLVSSIATDAGGNVVIAGVTGGALAAPNKGSSDAWVAKYDASGKRKWIKQFGTAADDAVAGVVVDGSGHVVLVGTTKGHLGGSTRDRSWLAKYDDGGKRLWQRQVEIRDAAGVAIDPAGDLVIAGTVPGSLGRDLMIAKFDGAGQPKWERTLDISDYDNVTSIAADGMGNILIAGYAGYDQRETLDAWVVKTDSEGDLLWTRFVFDQFSSAIERARGVTSDENGNVIACGYTEFGTYGDDAWVAKYAADGTLRWKRVLGTEGFDEANAVIADGTDVIVAGSTGGALGGRLRGGMDAVVIGYDGRGKVRWKRQLGTADGDDAAYGVATSDGGTTFIAGVIDYRSNTLGEMGDAFVAAYSDQ